MTRLSSWLAAIAAAIILVAPLLVADAYFRNVLVLCGVYAIFAVSIDLIVGFMGVLSFGHAAFLGIGAYTCGLMLAAGAPYWVAAPSGAAVAGLAGLLASAPALRLRGVYFAIATLACAEIVRIAAVNMPDLTGGPVGLTTPQPSFPLLPAGQQMLGFYYLGWGGLIVLCFFLFRFLDSPRGRAWLAIRENERLASAVGVPVFVFKAAAFTLSAALAGYAGAIYAPFIGELSPDVFSVSYSALGLLMVIIGGRGTIIGPIAGAVIFSIVSELFRAAQDLRMIVFSAMLIALIAIAPRGVVAPLVDLFARSTRAASRRDSAGASWQP